MKKDETTKQRILSEALKLFASKGYEAVSVAQIAGAVGIKAPSLYKHYVRVICSDSRSWLRRRAAGSGVLRAAFPHVQHV